MQLSKVTIYTHSTQKKYKQEINKINKTTVEHDEGNTG